jgi:tryptophan synthase alpha chain
MIKSLFQTKQPFIGFVTAGDGGLDYSVSCCLAMIAGGVDIIEIGLPFSDPVADGPVIQRSSQRALADGVNAATVLTMARTIREKSSVPLVLFSYYNPLLQKGESFLSEAKLAGFDAVLVVDLPPIQNNNLYSYFNDIKSAGMYPIYVVSPSTSEERLKNIVNESDGFIYYACQKGTTGMKSGLPADFSQNMQRFRQATSMPIVVGFGIADQSSAASVMEYADGFVVGSAFVSLMEKNVMPTELTQLAQTIDPRKYMCR